MARPLESMQKIAPNIYRASEKCLYIIMPSGERKFCSQERFEKLVKRHEGNMEDLVAKYRTRVVNYVAPETIEQKRERLQKELAALGPAPVPEEHEQNDEPPADELSDDIDNG